MLIFQKCSGSSTSFIWSERKIRQILIISQQIDDQMGPNINIINYGNQEVMLQKNRVTITCESYRELSESGEQACIRYTGKQENNRCYA